jgi:hypothetical protein
MKRALPVVLIAGVALLVVFAPTLHRWSEAPGRRERQQRFLNLRLASRRVGSAVWLVPRTPRDAFGFTPRPPFRVATGSQFDDRHWIGRYTVDAVTEGGVRVRYDLGDPVPPWPFTPVAKIHWE